MSNWYNYVQQKLFAAGNPVSEKSLRTILDHMQVSLLQHNEEQIYLRAKPKDGQGVLQQTIGLKLLPSLLPNDQLNKYL